MNRGLLSVLISFTIVISSCDGLQQGDDNVCTKQEEYLTTKVVSYMKPYQERTFTWCWAFPPRCSKYRLRYSKEKKTEIVKNYRTKLICCDGYVENSNDACIPLCSEGCLHGSCIGPDTCNCEPGYGGDTCSISCPKGKWGPKCSRNCSCENGATCNPVLGNCTCTPGWIGAHCNTSCNASFYGHKCLEVCRCLNGASCDHISGKCDCTPGYTGPLFALSKDRYSTAVAVMDVLGVFTPESCTRMAKIDKGDVRVRRRIKGVRQKLCEKKCPEGKHGKECASECHCQNGGTCDHVTGKCLCTTGWSVIGYGSENWTYNKEITNKIRAFEYWTYRRILKISWTERITNEKVSQLMRTEEILLKRLKERKMRFAGHVMRGSSRDLLNLILEGSIEGGDVCGNICAAGTYGLNCSLECNCYNKAGCHHITGKCVCTPGYNGDKCQDECPIGKYGINCTETCECKNDAVCSHVNGTCECTKGFTGGLCANRTCPKNNYGEDCGEICQCNEQNTEVFFSVIFVAVAIPGLENVIANLAGPGSAVDDLVQVLILENTVQKCATVMELPVITLMGLVLALLGILVQSWQGRTCATPCPLQFYGEGCKERCTCHHGSACDPVTGKCTCSPGYYGEQCQFKCAARKHGINCEKDCECDWNNALSPGSNVTVDFGGRSVKIIAIVRITALAIPRLDSVSVKGDGKEKIVTLHPLCFVLECEKGYFGQNCSEKCPLCENGAGTCHHITGHCPCTAGYAGIRCSEVCPRGTYGFDCQNKCNCVNGAECYHVTGECMCLPGWQGPTCSKSCPINKYGINCSLNCTCHNGGLCRPNDGKCRCAPGYMGTNCKEICFEGYYGDDCASVCNLGPRMVCDNRNGPMCEIGLTGENCDIRVTAEHKKPNEEVGVGSGAYRRHFDNPVYQVQGAGCLNNATPIKQIKNDFGSISNKNAQRSKLGDDYLDDKDNLAERGGACGGSNEFYDVPKGKEVECYNPNIYYDIEDLKYDKNEHFYDEVKLKTVDDTPNETYDHLQHNRPSTDAKPHYHKMDGKLQAKSRNPDKNINEEG
ncbi:Protein draper [Nymphon striatum]|nr:Protein draper [Nymphon striatum]